MTRGPRNGTGHRIGGWHPQARHEDAVVRRARALRRQGKSYGAIGRTLGVNWRTVADWVNFVTRYDA